MPIIIDTTSDTLDQDLEQLVLTVEANKQVDAKYFSPTITGKGKSSVGFLSATNGTINTFMKETRRLLDDVHLNENLDKNKKRHDTHTFGNFFHKSGKKENEKFTKFENNLTTMLPPIALYSVIEDSDPVAISFPKNTAMYNLNAIETNWHAINKGTIDGEAATTYVLPVIQSLRLYDRSGTNPSTNTNNTTAATKPTKVSGQFEIYILFATILDNMNPNGHMVFANKAVHGGKTVNKDQGVISITPLYEVFRNAYDYKALNERLKNHLRNVIVNAIIPVTTAARLETIIGDLSIYDILTSQAVTTTHQAKEALLTFITVMAKRTKELKAKANRYPDVERVMINALVTFVQHLDLLNNIEEDLITTEMLAVMYKQLKDELKDTITINNIARHSLRLLLSKRLNELDDIHKSGGLYEFKAKNQQIKDAMMQNPKYSSQQKNIIATEEPLLMGQAGAGSGKSYTLGGRINYLRENGEDLNKVLVLSFTNVSANNITNRYPGVRSETLANMFNTIYTATFPLQNLSQPSTVANSIRLLYPTSSWFDGLNMDRDELGQFMVDFAGRIEAFDQSGYKKVDLQQELKRLSNMIEGNLDVVARILDGIEQTTLELQPIIIHQKLLNDGGALNIPVSYTRLNFIITDESQDISTFEYILLLELTIHYRSQLLIIGDGSQTLYEFRNSDPRYMNALESSGVFASHKLETNYRSNEEILVFANQFLQVIDANKYANIQLKSSSFKTPTEQSLYDAITIAGCETTANKPKEYEDTIATYMATNHTFIDWFIERVRKGEQVALMGWTRKEVMVASEVLEKLLQTNGLSHIPITSIMSTQERPMTILSSFAENKNETIKSLDPLNPQYSQELRRHSIDFANNAFNKTTAKQVDYYESVIMTAIDRVLATHEWQAWRKDLAAGVKTKKSAGGFLIQQLIRMETSKNAMDQILRKNKETPDYDKCPIIISTMHGAKGLEFDHTIVLYNETKKGATSQSSLRMLFVALSRAKKSEFIINAHRFSIPSAPRIISDSYTSMFQTPMDTAFLRTRKHIEALHVTTPSTVTTDDE